MEQNASQTIEGLKENGLLTEDNPDIIAIFQQIKNLRESERSIRSLRRSLTLDNMPVLELEEGELELDTRPADELTQVLDKYLDLKREKSDLERRFNELLNGFAELQDTVRRQSDEIAALKTR